MTFAAVLAGGIGSRMGAEMPKQYLEVGGKPILVRSVEQFACREDMACVLVLTPEDWVPYTRDLLLKYGMGPGDVPVTVLTGGATRNDTLRNAIDYLEKHFELGEDSVFVTHDAVREDGTVISDIPDRSRLHQMQTPQSFRPLKLKELMDSLTPEEEAVLTDGCKIYLLKGEPVAMVPGAVTNIKITYPSDLAFAEAFLKGEENA